MAGPQRLRQGSDGGTELLRTPPHSVEAEQSVLGGLLLDTAGLGPGRRQRRPRRFLPLRPSPDLRGDRRSSSPSRRPIDAVTVSDRLERQRQAAGGGRSRLPFHAGSRYAHRGERARLRHDRARARTAALAHHRGQRDRLLGVQRGRHVGARARQHGGTTRVRDCRARCTAQRRRAVGALACCRSSSTRSTSGTAIRTTARHRHRLHGFRQQDRRTARR